MLSCYDEDLDWMSSEDNANSHGFSIVPVITDTVDKRTPDVNNDNNNNNNNNKDNLHVNLQKTAENSEIKDSKKNNKNPEKKATIVNEDALLNTKKDENNAINSPADNKNLFINFENHEINSVDKNKKMKTKTIKTKKKNLATKEKIDNANLDSQVTDKIDTIKDIQTDKNNIKNKVEKSITDLGNIKEKFNLKNNDDIIESTSNNNQVNEYKSKPEEQIFKVSNPSGLSQIINKEIDNNNPKESNNLKHENNKISLKNKTDNFTRNKSKDSLDRNNVYLNSCKKYNNNNGKKISLNDSNIEKSITSDFKKFLQIVDECMDKTENYSNENMLV